MKKFIFDNTIAHKLLSDKRFLKKNFKKFKKSLKKYCEGVDKRQKGKVKYPLYEIVFLVIYGIFKRKRDIESIINLVRKDNPEVKNLRKVYPYKNLDMSRRSVDIALRSIDQYSFSSFICLFRKTILENIGRREEKTLGMPHIAIDGKYANGSKKGTKHRFGYDVLNAYDTDNHIHIESVIIDKKDNEKTAVKSLIPKLEEEYALITGDAMLSEANIIETVVDKGYEYLFPIKKNNKAMEDYLTSVFRYAKEKADRFLIKPHRNRDNNVSREAYVLDADEWLDETKLEWTKGITAIGMIKTTRTYVGKKDRDRKPSCQTRYFITSLYLTAEQLSDIVLRHWEVETSHKRMDCIYGEDGFHISDINAVKILNEIIKLVDYMVLVASVQVTGKKDKKSVSALIRFLDINVELFFNVFALGIP